MLTISVVQRVVKFGSLIKNGKLFDVSRQKGRREAWEFLALYE